MLRAPLTPPPDFPDFPGPFFRIQYLVASYEAIDFPPGSVPLFRVIAFVEALLEQDVQDHADRDRSVGDVEHRSEEQERLAAPDR